MLDKGDYVKLRSLSHKGAADAGAVERLCNLIFAPLRELQEQEQVR